MFQKGFDNAFYLGTLHVAYPDESKRVWSGLTRDGLETAEMKP